MDCATISQCIDVLTSYNNPVQELVLLYPEVEKELVERLFNKYKDISRVAEILSFPVNNDTEQHKELPYNAWHADSPLSRKLNKESKVKAPIIRNKPTFKQDYILVPLESVMMEFYKDKELSKSSAAYQHEMNHIKKLKLELSGKARDAYGSRRSNKYSGLGGTVASTYSEGIRELDDQYEICRVKHAYSVLKEQQTGPFEFDFHGLYVREVKLILMNIISFYRLHRVLINGNSVAPSIKLITGKGNNSYSGYSVLNASIKKLLEENNIYFDNESTTGTIIINLNK